MAPEDEVDALLAAVAHRPDDELAAASAQARSRGRWLRQQTAESATLTGILLALAEREDAVTVHAGPWSSPGQLRSVTSELVILDGPAGLVLVATAAITMVEAPVLVADDRSPGSGPDLAAVLASLAPGRPQVRLLLDDGRVAAGILLELGKNVAAVRMAGSFASVSLQAITGCVLLSPKTIQDDGSGNDLGSLDDLGSG